MRYAVCTQLISFDEAARPAWISVSEAETIWMSRIAMNMPNTMQRNVISRRGSIRSASAEAGWGTAPAVMVVASAMLALRLGLAAAVCRSADREARDRAGLG